MRAWPFPYMKLMHPFLLGGAATLYIFAKIQHSMSAQEIYVNDPNNPRYAEFQAAKKKAAEGGH